MMGKQQLIIRYLLAGWLMLNMAPLQAESRTIFGARVWSAPDNTRIVFDLSGPVEYQMFRLSDPDRIVIDFTDTTLRDNLDQLRASVGNYFSQVRFAAREKHDFRVVLDMTRKVTPNSMLLKPNDRYGYRLVLDLVEQGEQKGGETLQVAADKSRAELRDLVIAIDAGHGGEDPGAIGRGKTQEKDVVLAIARKLQQAVNREAGMRAVMIRDGDYFVPLKKRRQLAGERKADMFISIHADAYRKTAVKGASVFVLAEKGASSEVARMLAESENATDVIGGVNVEEKDEVLASVLLDLTQSGTLGASRDLGARVLTNLDEVGAVHKGVVEHANFVVLKALGIPSLLVETGFISNREEEHKLKSPAHQTRLADAILNGVKSYFADNAPPGTLLASRNLKHVVKSGDTLNEIAQQYKTSPEAIRKVNELSTDMLNVGRVLIIPSS